MPIDWREHIVSTVDILRGKPRIKGTRIPVSLILGYLAAGHTAEEIMAELPDLRKGADLGVSGLCPRPFRI